MAKYIESNNINNRILAQLQHYLPLENIDLTNYINQKKVNKNELIVQKGQISKYLYIVTKGCLRTYYIDKRGNEKTRFVAFEGSFITALASFVSQKPSSEFVDALEDSEVLYLSYEHFEEICQKSSAFQQLYRDFLEKAYIEQNAKIENLVTLSAKQRYEKILLEKPHFVLRLSNRILASYIDVSQETLSRLKSK